MPPRIGWAKLRDWVREPDLRNIRLLRPLLSFILRMGTSFGGWAVSGNSYIKKVLFPNPKCNSQKVTIVTDFAEMY